MKKRHIVLITLDVIIFIVLLQNTQVVTVRVLFWKLSMSRVILLPLFMLAGFAIGIFAGRRTCGKWVILALLSFFTIFNGSAIGETEESVMIKFGMRENTVVKKIGEPLLREKLKSAFLISRKKALYRADDSSYMVIKFFAGTVKEVIFIDNADEGEAIKRFRELD